MNAIEEALGRLSTRQQQKVSSAFAALESGDLTRAEFSQVVVNVVERGNRLGRHLGTAVARALIEAEVEAAQLVTMRKTPGLVRPEEERIAQAVTTILGSDQDTLMQLQRMADNEPKQAAADGSADVIRGSRRVQGWTRDLDADACQLCEWWARDGRVWQPDHVMPRHTGCTCGQRPVVTRTSNFQTEKQVKETADRQSQRSRRNA